MEASSEVSVESTLISPVAEGEATANFSSSPVLNPESFPIEALPPLARRMAEAISASYQVPVGLPAATLLGVGSCAIGKGLVTRAYFGLTPANLYLVLGASTGAGKSLGYKTLIEPILQVQTYAQKLKHIFNLPPKEESLDVESEEEGDENDDEEPDADSSATIESVGQKVAERHREYDDKQRQPPVLLSEDITPIAMAYMLWENRECLSSASADALGLLNKLGGKTSDQHAAIQGFYLKCYSEDAAAIGRVARKITLAEPNLSILWLTQLKPLDQFASHDHLRDCGFSPRCLLGRFDFEKLPLNESQAKVDDTLNGNWRQLVLDLLDTYRVNEVRQVAVCSPEAGIALRNYANEVLELQQGKLVDVSAHLVRVAENSIRLALVLHALQHGKNAHQHPISLGTAQGAIQVSRWFMNQTLELLVVKREQKRKDEEAEVLRMLHEGSPEGRTARWFEQRHLAPSKAEVKAILERMVAKGTVVSRPHVPQRGGHSTTYYTLPIEADGQPLTLTAPGEVAIAE